MFEISFKINDMQSKRHFNFNRTYEHNFLCCFKHYIKNVKLDVLDHFPVFLANKPVQTDLSKKDILSSDAI